MAFAVLGIGIVPGVLTRCSVAIVGRLLVIIFTNYEAEPHSQAGRVGWRRGVPRRRTPSQLSESRRRTRRDDIRREPGHPGADTARRCPDRAGTNSCLVLQRRKQKQPWRGRRGRTHEGSKVHEEHFARHLKRMRAPYAARRRALANGLSRVFGDRITVDLKPGGMHLIARFGAGVCDIKLAELAQAGGFSVEALSRRSTPNACGQGCCLDSPTLPRRTR